MAEYHKEIWVKIRQSDVPSFLAALGIPYKKLNHFSEIHQEQAKYESYKYISKGGKIEVVTGVYDDMEIPTEDPAISLMLDVTLGAHDIRKAKKNLL